MKKISTIFARAVVYLVALAALSICVILLPELAREEATGKPDVYIPYLFLGVSYVISIPFFVALYQTLKLLNFIDRDKFFSLQSIKALQNIKYCTAVFSILIILAVVGAISLIKSIGPAEDVTFMVPIGAIFVFVASVIGVFVALLQKLLADAVAMKSENDLIV